MKANKFVEKFGWKDSKICLLNCASPEDKWLMRQGELICDQDFDDLKRLVESHELVELYGGVGQAKFWVDMMAGADSMQKKIDRVNQAIADVESCLEADKKLEGL